MGSNPFGSRLKRRYIRLRSSDLSFARRTLQPLPSFSRRIFSLHCQYDTAHTHTHVQINKQTLQTKSRNNFFNQNFHKFHKKTRKKTLQLLLLGLVQDSSGIYKTRAQTHIRTRSRSNTITQQQTNTAGQQQQQHNRKQYEQVTSQQHNTTPTLHSTPLHGTPRHNTHQTKKTTANSKVRLLLVYRK